MRLLAISNTTALPRAAASLLLTLATFAVPAGAQSVTFLESQVLDRIGGRVRVKLVRQQGSRRAEQAWPEEGPPWLFVRAAGGQQNYGPERPFPRAEGALVLRLAPGDATLVGAELERRSERIAAEQLLEFIELHVSPQARPKELSSAALIGPQLVRRTESLKLVVRSDRSKIQPSGSAQAKSGQYAEIRPFADPTRTPVGSDLPFRVYLPGGAKHGRLTATHLPSGAKQVVALDAAGIGYITLNAVGTWTLQAHSFRKIEEPDSGDKRQSAWDLVSTTLVFEARANRQLGQER
ncbi:MAG: hypothetical protein ACI841_001208 [Planctomycetota bacterium]|jgi:hypothetical protein